MKKKRKQIQAKNDLENLVYQMRNTLKWLDEHPQADKDDYETKKKRIRRNVATNNYCCL